MYYVVHDSTEEFFGVTPTGRDLASTTLLTDRSCFRWNFDIVQGHNGKVNVTHSKGSGLRSTPDRALASPEKHAMECWTVVDGDDIGMKYFMVGKLVKQLSYSSPGYPMTPDKSAVEKWRLLDAQTLDGAATIKAGVPYFIVDHYDRMLGVRGKMELYSSKKRGRREKWVFDLNGTRQTDPSIPVTAIIKHIDGPALAQDPGRRSTSKVPIVVKEQQGAWLVTDIGTVDGRKYVTGVEPTLVLQLGAHLTPI